jgi:hypothetical protein
MHLEELFVGGALNLDQVRHLYSFNDLPVGFPNTLLRRERQSHVLVSSLFSGRSFHP